MDDYFFDTVKVPNKKKVQDYCNKVAYFSVGKQPGKKFRVAKYGVDYVLRNEIAVEGKVRFFADRDEAYGGECSTSYLGPVLVNPTWGQCFTEFKKMMAHTLDVHHVFFEGIYKAKDQSKAVGLPSGVVIYEFSAGS